MKTIQQALDYNFQCIDERDKTRLALFLSLTQLEKIGLEIKEEAKETWKPKAWTRNKILKQLKDDVAFGFEKALDKRGLSAGAMYEVVKFWNWVLGEGLENWNDDNYAQYGLPLFKATALKYGWDNPIGGDVGNEEEYSEECEW